MSFKDKLLKITQKNDSLLCIGLDPELEKIPAHMRAIADPLFHFNKYIIDKTHDLVAAYKPNIAFYEAEGIDGLRQLKKTLEYLKSSYPEIPVILDAKRGDIGNTARMYAKSVYEYWGADAVTVFPHLGLDAIEPFLKYKDKLAILLLKTSNKDSGMFQDLKVGTVPYYLAMAKKIAVWPTENIGIFVGATYPAELKKMRLIFPDHIFLTAGIGAQKGDLEKAVRAGVDKNGGGIIFNASRSIIYADSGVEFATRARDEAEKVRNEINSYR